MSEAKFDTGAERVYSHVSYSVMTEMIKFDGLGFKLLCM